MKLLGEPKKAVEFFFKNDVPEHLSVIVEVLQSIIERLPRRGNHMGVHASDFGAHCSNEKMKAVNWLSRNKIISAHNCNLSECKCDGGLVCRIFEHQMPHCKRVIEGYLNLIRKTL